LQRLFHPEQDRVLTTREQARIQGFPDWLKLHGKTKQKCATCSLPMLFLGIMADQLVSL